MTGVCHGWSGSEKKVTGYSEFQWNSRQNWCPWEFLSRGRMKT